MEDSNLVDRIKSELRKFWKEQSLSPDAGSISIDDLVAAMDSVTAVDVLMTVEEIVEVELPAGKVIRPGGYSSEAQFIEDLTDRVLKYLKELANEC